MLNLKNRKAQFAWFCVAAWSLVIVGLFASDSFSSDMTGTVIKAVIRFFVPDINPHLLFRLHWQIRKAAHFTEYAILALLCLRALLLSMSVQGHRLRAAAFALLYVLLVAIVDESRQAFVSTQRSGRALDALIDLSGAAAALLAWWLFLVWHRSRKASDRPGIPSERARKENC